MIQIPGKTLAATLVGRGRANCFWHFVRLRIQEQDCRSCRALVLFTESLDIRFAVGIEEFLAALLPRRS